MSRRDIKRLREAGVDEATIASIQALEAQRRTSGVRPEDAATLGRTFRGADATMVVAPIGAKPRRTRLAVVIPLVLAIAMLGLWALLSFTNGGK